MASTTHIKRAGTLIAVALASMLLAATAAFAQYPPPEDFSVSCTPEVVAPGGEITCSITGAVAGENLDVTAEYNPVFFEETVTANDDGEVSVDIAVPDDADDGDGILVTVVGEQSGETGTDTVDVEVDDDGPKTPPDDGKTPPDDGATPPGDGKTPGDDLPRTGVESSTLIIAGAGLLLLGAATVLLARRRDRGRVEA